MLKYVGMVLYVIASLFIGYYVFMSSYFARPQKLFNDNQGEVAYEEDPDKFLSIQLSVADMYYDSYRYFSKDPIFETSIDQDGNKITLEVYAAGLQRSFADSKDVVRLDSLFFYFRGLEFKDNTSPAMRVRVYLNSPSFLVEDQKKIYKDFIYASENSSQISPLFSITDAEGELKDSETNLISTIVSIQISVCNSKTDVEDKNYIFDETQALLELNFTEKLEGFEPIPSIHTVSFSYNNSDFIFSDRISDPIPTKEQALLYNLNIEHIGSLSKYNYIMVLALTITVFVFLALGYLLFFHKKVMIKYRAKKGDKIKAEYVPKEESLFNDDVSKENKTDNVVPLTGYEAFKKKQQSKKVEVIENKEEDNKDDDTN